jgi:hypothetical protein
MLSHCANSQCSKPFLRLREGKLFLVEATCGPQPSKEDRRLTPFARKPPRRVEHFWLCDRCASIWTLIQNGNQGIALVPLTSAGAKSPAENLRTVAAGRTGA